MRDYEQEVFDRLQGKRKHFCPDWDGMAIDDTMMEIEGCICDFEPPTRLPLGQEGA